MSYETFQKLDNAKNNFEENLTECVKKIEKISPIIELGAFLTAGLMLVGAGAAIMAEIPLLSRFAVYSSAFGVGKVHQYIASYKKKKIKKTFDDYVEQAYEILTDEATKNGTLDKPQLGVSGFDYFYIEQPRKLASKPYKKYSGHKLRVK